MSAYILKSSGSKFILLVWYVLLASSKVYLLNETKGFLRIHFDMKYMGEASYVFVIEIVRDKSRCMLGLSQKYVSKILQRFDRYA